MKYVMPAIRFKIFMTILLGLIYPFTMTGISKALFARQADGDLLFKEGKVVGARLIGQNFEQPKYFWSRPSAINYNPLPSGGSNLAQTSRDLKKIVEERRIKLKAAHGQQLVEPPQDLLFSSGSGLDPHISPESAQYQSQRVAKVRHISVEQIQKLIKLSTEKRIMGILGESSVNVLVLNLALDQIKSVEAGAIELQR